MSVPKSKRAVSEYEFYTNAQRIRVQLTEWLMRDFGAKTRIRDLSLIAKRERMSDEDRAVLAEILERYGMGDQICETYPGWWIAERRRKLDRIAASIAENICGAFDLYATCVAEWEERRLMQDRAIAGVYQLLEETQFVVAVLYKTGGVDEAKYMPFVALCEAEIKLLKGWRQAGNEIRRRLVRKDVAERAKIEAKLRSA